MAIDRVSDLDGCGELSGDTDAEWRREVGRKGKEGNRRRLK